MMPRYIDAEKLLKKMGERYNNFLRLEGYYEHFTMGYGEATETVENEPTADVQEVKHGKWLRVSEFQKSWTRVCSVCGNRSYMIRKVYPYCPNCSAKMEKSDDKQ